RRGTRAGTRHLTVGPLPHTLALFARQEDRLLSTHNQTIYRRIRLIFVPTFQSIMSKQSIPTGAPGELGYYFPAEFAPHEATWLSWPHKEASWPGKIEAIYPYYSAFVKELTRGEQVRINVVDEGMKQSA